MQLGAGVRTYTELFDLRGSAYDRAMRRYPNARDAEFEQVVNCAGLRPGMVVADVPAGGGYLARYLPAGCACVGHEPCDGFVHHGVKTEPGRPFLPLPWKDDSIDVVISLAGVHHMEDKRPFWRETLRVTRPGGRFVLSDAAEGSAVAKFLDGFVGDFNSTGHDGVFLCESDLKDLSQAGWRILAAEQVAYHWRFAGRDEMADFCQGLFDISTASRTRVGEAIERDLGCDGLSDGQVGMRWSLMTIVAEKPGD